jgi:hypothetical protein
MPWYSLIDKPGPEKKNEKKEEKMTQLGKGAFNASSKWVPGPSLSSY